MDKADESVSIGYDCDSDGPYKRLPLSPFLRIFRLWRFSKTRWGSNDLLRFEMKNFLFEENLPGYLALSYVWGSRTNTRAVLVNGELVFITANLWDFTKVLFEQDRYLNQWFWADQMSMNQRDLQERNHQVGLMGQIYAAADIVLAYIGPAIPNAIAYNRENLFQAATTSKETQVSQKTRIAVAVNIFEREYWTRLWIAQEIKPAKEVIFCCGNTFINRVFLLAVINDFFPHTQATEDLLRGTRSLKSIEAQFQGQNHALTDLLIGRTHGSYNLLDALDFYSGKICADPRDKIYGLQALIKEDQRIVIDYAKCYEDLLHDALTIVYSNPDDVYMMPKSGSRLDRAPRSPVELRRLVAPEYEMTFKARTWAYLIGGLLECLRGDQIPEDMSTQPDLAKKVAASAITARQRALVYDLRQNTFTSYQYLALGPSLYTGLTIKHDRNTLTNVEKIVKCHGFIQYGRFLSHPTEWPYFK